MSFNSVHVYYLPVCMEFFKKVKYVPSIRFLTHKSRDSVADRSATLLITNQLWFSRGGTPSWAEDCGRAGANNYVTCRCALWWNKVGPFPRCDKRLLWAGKVNEESNEKISPTLSHWGGRDKPASARYLYLFPSSLFASWLCYHWE